VTDRWYESGLRFSCTACGRCCTRHGDAAYVYVREDEAEAIAARLDLPLDEFARRHLVEEDGWLTFPPDREQCAFLSPDGKCEIYDVRPMQCRTWPFWEPNLASAEAWRREVQAICPGSRDENGGTLHDADTAERIARETEEHYEAE